MKEFNGHRSWNAWNVSLFICNERRFYDVVNATFQRTLLRTENKKKAINAAIKRFMSFYGYQKTPDGAVFNHLSVKLAICGLYDD